ncbi:MAG: HD domain-containing protein [Treponema sp.]|nr:HD domain-containing protein [Treponema sp.]
MTANRRSGVRMLNISLYLVLIEFCLMIANVLLCIYFLLSKRTVLIKNEGMRLILTIFVLILMIGIVIMHYIVFSRNLPQSKTAIVLFCGELVFTLTLFMFFMQFVGAEEHGMEILETVIGFVEAGDPNLEGHTINVKNLVLMLYDELPLRYRMRLNPSRLACAALLLDLGKLGISYHIITKTGKLEDEEKAILNRHPEIGARILNQIPSFEEISEWIKYHHERVDGKGYYHLKDKEIPLESRILAVADTFSALTMERNYKSSLTYTEAISELKLVAGKQLDAEIVEYFCQVPLRKIEESLGSVKKKMQFYQHENSEVKYEERTN